MTGDDNMGINRSIIAITITSDAGSVHSPVHRVKII